MMDNLEITPKKKPKRWQCCVCNRKFCYINGACKHNLKKHENKAKFREINEERFMA
jgi:hypothetical protein